MAWQSHGRTNHELIQALVRSGLLATPRVIEAFHRVDRKFFVPQSYNQYQDAPQPLEPSDDTEGATISAPHMHAYAVESLAPHCKPNGRVLDIGNDLVAGPKALVLGVDHIPTLVAQSKNNLARLYAPDPIPDRISIICHDGRTPLPPPYSEGEGFDVIHVGAMCESIPDFMIDSLKNGGRLWIPYQDHIWIVDKDALGNVENKRLFGARYVPQVIFHP